MTADSGVTPAVPSAEPARATRRVGFRLARVEVLNWGTFHRQIWSVEVRCENALLTGDIGSGKSTLVDAITTLLVPPQKLAYNKAAEAEKHERSLRTYVMGHYKKERGDDGQTSKAVALRDHNAYSVVLGQFFDEAYGRWVTLAQAFWWKSTNVNVQPERLFLVSEKALTIGENFSSFGTEIKGLRKRLQKLGSLHDSFAAYSSDFRSRFGIETPQALDLFHQTVSMKSVGNLTEFVRQHMLEPFDVEPRIKHLIRHFDDLNRAHEAVLKAKAQIARLTPIVQECQRFADLAAEMERSQRCREALKPWFAEHKRELLGKRLLNIAHELERIDAQIDTLTQAERKAQADRDEVKEAIAANGGDRLERLKRDIEQQEKERDARQARATQYERLAAAIGLPGPVDQQTFLTNRQAITDARAAADEREERATNDFTETSVVLRKLMDEHKDVLAEVASLRSRPSNIPGHMLSLRQRLCREVGLEESALPFAGELIQVRSDAAEWEGAAERLLHGFAQSLLVTEAHYQQVVDWVNRTHLGNRLVYFRIREARPAPRTRALTDRPLFEKLDVKPDSRFYGWLDAELARRADYSCCDTIDQFRRAQRAITREGQTKDANERHEKDDRHRIDDRTRYVLGWSNVQKIAALEASAKALELKGAEQTAKLRLLQQAQRDLKERVGVLRALAVFERFVDLEWRPVQAEIERLLHDRERMEAESDVLRALQARLTEIEGAIKKTGAALDVEKKAYGAAETKQEQARKAEQECATVVAATTPEQRSLFPTLVAMRAEALGDHQLTVESCDNRERELRDWIQKRLDADSKKRERLNESIVKQMEGYSKDYSSETREVDVSVEAAGEYVEMLRKLQSDDLPRFETQFKKLLNENTINEVASFNSQLRKESETISERIQAINRSLHAINYNPARYIMLDLVPETDREVREFREELRACTMRGLTASDDDTYSEERFGQVKTIIERFRGREGTTDADEKWTRKVTDVRNWYRFAASEKWREDDRLHEYYADSGGKSGGQKEKLAYTVLAASLVYQFGLEESASRSRSFRFVMIDEAFGRGSDESATYGLELFKSLGLQLLIVTPLQKIHIIEPFVESVTFVHNDEGRSSSVLNMTIEEYRARRAAHGGVDR